MQWSSLLTNLWTGGRRPLTLIPASSASSLLTLSSVEGVHQAVQEPAPEPPAGVHDPQARGRVVTEPVVLPDAGLVYPPESPGQSHWIPVRRAEDSSAPNSRLREMPKRITAAADGMARDITRQAIISRHRLYCPWVSQSYHLTD